MTITSAPPVARPVRRTARVAVLWLLIVPGLLWALIRLGGWESGPLVQLLAFTPYVAVWAWLPLVLALLARRWVPAAVAALAALLLAGAVLPRALPGDRGPEQGVRLTVMTANVFFGTADASAVVRLVREHDVAVLALQEFTEESRDALAAAGLGALLPHSQLTPEPGASGSGIYSRFPIAQGGGRRTGGGMLQAAATIQPAGAGALAVESAHPLAPATLSMLDGWRADLQAQARPDRAGPPRVLLGDFNATLDHAPLRELIAAGYRDAADADGAGLSGTWGPYADDPIPPVTIDHVLVDERIGVRDVSVHGIPGSDHRAVVATLTVPAAS